MSLVAESVTRRVVTTVPRAVVQTTATTTAQSTHIMAAASTRTLTTTPAAQRKATEVVKESLKTVDRAVSNKIVDGINIGSTVAQKLKEAGKEIAGAKVTGKAAELRDEAKGKASEATGKADEAKGKASELAGKAKGKMDEIAQ